MTKIVLDDLNTVWDEFLLQSAMQQPQNQNTWSCSKNREALAEDIKEDKTKNPIQMTYDLIKFLAVTIILLLSSEYFHCKIFYYLLLIPVTIRNDLCLLFFPDQLCMSFQAWVEQKSCHDLRTSIYRNLYACYTHNNPPHSESMPWIQTWVQ